MRNDPVEEPFDASRTALRKALDEVNDLKRLVAVFGASGRDAKVVVDEASIRLEELLELFDQTRGGDEHGIVSKWVRHLET